MPLSDHLFDVVVVIVGILVVSGSSFLAIARLLDILGLRRRPALKQPLESFRANDRLSGRLRSVRNQECWPLLDVQLLTSTSSELSIDTRRVP